MLPDAVRAAIAGLCAAAFAAAQLALLRRIAAAPDLDDAPVRGRLGRGAELGLALVPALLTALLLAWVLRAATSPVP
ncbi:MAG TPA: hypothetical protein VIC56_02920 [Gemmatimonadota bacterium]|jgi:hypothetical protein